MSENKRSARRRPLDCSAKLLLDNGVSVIASVRNVTTGGLAVIVPEDLAPGLSCVVTFTIPAAGGPRPLSAKAIVRHSSKVNGDGHSVGLQFVGIDRDSAWAVWEFASLSSAHLRS